MSSLSSIGGKKGSIFVLGSSRDSAITRLKNTNFKTEELLDEVTNLYHIELKAEAEIKTLKKILAEKLQREEFGSRNGALTEAKLALFVDNTRVFDWFAKTYSGLAGRIEAGLRERLTTPMSDAERVWELEERLRELENQRYPRLPQKRFWVAGPGQSSGREESDGRDDSGRDALGDPLHGSDTVLGRDDTGGESSVATNTVEVVPNGGKTREEIERDLAADYDKKLAEEVERRVAVRAKEIQRDINRKSLLAEQKRVQDMLDAYQKNYNTEKDKWTTYLQAATDSAEKQRIQSKLDKAKTNYDTYVKRQKNAIEVYNIWIQSLDETGDMGGPSSLDETEDMGGPSTSAFE
ncbi:hypothetical protein HK104_006530 [Borealophlyctis nickersoniae]|nr:hypothetical protein HK104_006530 [Borealophlyctis nickersoniae]